MTFVFNPGETPNQFRSGEDFMKWNLELRQVGEVPCRVILIL